jgi:hypothetical protein
MPSHSRRKPFPCLAGVTRRPKAPPEGTKEVGELRRRDLGGGLAPLQTFLGVSHPPQRVELFLFHLVERLSHFPSMYHL